MARLKVLFITPWYPSEHNPAAGVFVREQAKAVQLYEDVLVLHCYIPDPDLQRLYLVEQETDESLTENILTYRTRYKVLPLPKISHLLYLGSVLQAFRMIVAQGFVPTIVHAHTYRAGLPAALISKLYSLPLVVTEHSTAFPRQTLTKLKVWQARLVFNLADIVLPVSRLLQQAIERYNIKAHFQVIPNVVDTNLFAPDRSIQGSDSVKRLLFVGLLGRSHKKGVPYLIEALAQLRQHRDDWRCDLIGDGPVRSEYEKMALNLNLTDKITFHGLKSNREVAQFMKRTDIFVVPSLFETFSVVAAEALATGIPVVATRCGGPEEFINDAVGMLVPAGDATALSQGLAATLDTLSGYSSKKIVRYAKEQFSPEVVGLKLHTVYQSLI